MRKLITILFVLFVFLPACLFLFPLSSKITKTRAATKPNIVIIVTDDQTYNSIPYMPFLSSKPGGSWIDFKNGYGNLSFCCPGRATILTGLYAHHHGIQDGEGGEFKDTSTIATWLDNAGYTTALFGKYLNDYLVTPKGNRPKEYIPPGWDQWYSIVEGGYYNYTLNENRKIVNYGTSEADYSTDVLAKRAVSFIKTAPEPFFVYFAPRAPHAPETPALRHVGVYKNLPINEPPNFNEEDVSDKPGWIKKLSRFDKDKEIILADRQRSAYESLLAVDEAISQFVQELEKRAIYNNTVIFYTTDNGFSWGNHRWIAKQCEYEECLRLPFLVRYPWISSRDESKLVENIDFAPTIADLAGIKIPMKVDGLSLVPLMKDKNTTWRSSLLFEGSLRAGNPPPFWAVRDETWKYVNLSGKIKELYNLKTDPYELENLSGRKEYKNIEASMLKELTRLISK